MRRLYAHYVCLKCGVPQELKQDVDDTEDVSDPFPDEATCKKCKGTARRRDL